MVGGRDANSSSGFRQAKREKRPYQPPQIYSHKRFVRTGIISHRLIHTCGNERVREYLITCLCLYRILFVCHVFEVLVLKAHGLRCQCFESPPRQCTSRSCSSHVSLPNAHDAVHSKTLQELECIIINQQEDPRHQPNKITPSLPALFSSFGLSSPPVPPPNPPRKINHNYPASATSQIAQEVIGALKR